MKKILFSGLLLLIFLIVLLTSKEDYKILKSEYFQHKDLAAIQFYKTNMDRIKSLHKEQELLGWVLECKEGYTFTTSVVGGVSNVLLPNPNWGRQGCRSVGLVHTHPEPKHFGSTSDLFSEEDIKTSYNLTVYMMAQENCNLRKANEGRDVFIGKFENCK